ncbi:MULTISPECIES: DNA primase [unclassified Virgibacillus]|uniref:DNA primase n=1 Tax=unclassified Virgibacillus TaxID=2620237 RepID=UPI0024DE7F9D|nr:DNA primase [Virgibacillus sp. LDC-1]
MSNQIPEELIEQVRQANDIVEVVGEYVQLKKQGRNFFGLCPFHGEKTPSFSVTQDKQIFHCFGCGKGGNVITFLMEMESFSFHEAVRELARRSDIALPEFAVPQETSMSQEQQQMVLAFDWLTKLYHHLLRYTKDGKEGYQYFQDRGINDETIDAFKLGFAPRVKNFTASFLEKKGIHQQILVKAGLITVHDDHSITDKFKGRVIYPIRNHLGKTVGFGGRSITEDGPKYLNSSESELFRKGKLLFNFDLAKKYIRKTNEVILFEGYMDVISAYQAGIRNTVATMGTALTETQAKLLRRYTELVVICFDGDQAGLEGAYKAATLLRQTGCQVKIANIKDGLDPDSFINQFGGEAFQREVITPSDPFIAFYMRYVKRDFNMSLEGDRIQYIELIIKELSKLESSIELEFYLNELHTEFDISLETLKEELGKHRGTNKHKQDKRLKDRYTKEKSNFYQAPKMLPAFHKAERQLIAYMLQDHYIASRVQEELGAGFNIDAHKIIATHLYAYYEEGRSSNVSNFIQMLEDEEVRQLVIEIAMIPIHEEISEKEINDYIRLIQMETNDVSSIRELKKQQLLAEQQNDTAKAAHIAMQIIQLQKHMKQ